MRTRQPTRGPLISVIIPCYEQARFLGEAIEGALGQTWRDREVLVIDDGSTDGVAEVVGRYPTVRCVRRENGGTAAARNTGLAESRGEYLVFLDADDRLLPVALEKGLDLLLRHPGYAFASGLSRLITEDGSPRAVSPLADLAADPYGTLLRSCPIWHPASVLFRRRAVEDAGGFDPDLAVCSDYDLYLRIARRWPVAGHGELVSEYRQHGANKSLGVRRMREHMIRILRSQRPFVRESRELERARRQGLLHWRWFYSKQLVRVAWASRRRRYLERWRKRRG